MVKAGFAPSFVRNQHFNFVLLFAWLFALQDLLLGRDRAVLSFGLLPAAPGGYIPRITSARRWFPCCMILCMYRYPHNGHWLKRGHEWLTGPAG